MKRYGDIDLAGNDLLDVTLERLTSSPTVRTGRVYFNTTDAVAQVYDGANWKDMWAPDDDFHTLTSEGTTQGTDEILIYDSSAAGYRRQTKDNFFQSITGYLPAAVAPGGADGYVQYNNGGAFGGQNEFSWSDTDYNLTIERSHTATFSPTLAPGNPMLKLYNFEATAGSKYAAVEFAVRYQVGDTAYSYIVSEATAASPLSNMHFMVVNGSGTALTPLSMYGNGETILRGDNVAIGTTIDATYALNVAGDGTYSTQLAGGLEMNLDTAGGWGLIIKNADTVGPGSSIIRLYTDNLTYNTELQLTGSGTTWLNFATYGGDVLKVNNDNTGALAFSASVAADFTANNVTTYISTASLHTWYFYNGGNLDTYWGIGIQAGYLSHTTAGTRAHFIRFYDNSGNYEGSIINDNGTVQFLQNSDLRKKRNIRSVDTDVEHILMGVQVREFEWREGGGSKIGWIAQQCEDFYPAMTSYDQETDTHGVMPSELVPLLHWGYQNHTDRIKQLESEVLDLKRKLNEALR